MIEKIIEFLQDYKKDGRCEDGYQRENIPLWIEYPKSIDKSTEILKLLKEYNRICIKWGGLLYEGYTIDNYIVCLNPKYIFSYKNGGINLVTIYENIEDVLEIENNKIKLKDMYVYLVREVGACRHTSYNGIIAVYQNIEDARGYMGALKSDFLKQMENGDLDWSSYNYDIEETENDVFISCKDDESLHHEFFIETHELK